MNNELERLWKQPTFENLDRGVRLHREDNLAWVHDMFALLLCVTSEELPSKTSTELLKLETARKVVKVYHREAEAAWQEQGFITKWSPDCLEGIAREMADKLPRHPFVVNAIKRMLENRRDVVFADRSLTRDDELFFVRRTHRSQFPREMHEYMAEIGIEVVYEDCIVTIDRSLDYINELKSIKASRQFIKLYGILTSMKRAYAVVQGN
jgi:hypothetical protein